MFSIRKYKLLRAIHFDRDTNLALVQETGFNIIQVEDEMEYEYNKPVFFRWIIASKSE
ncbi:hypothetical protein NIES4071_29850 [Calothrix sp. NIES-4071]|nr:hypothetical protein NIES4071_29850 [Calothrix sp. NIES-4071]BAZ57305.1 hypothetical protein NIES4105_29790 [Calothrix sp. NIES-4105]